MRFPIAFLPILALALALPAAPLSAETSTTAPASGQSASGQSASGQSASGQSAADQSLGRLPAISVITAASRHLEAHVIATGLVQPVETVDVAPLIQGQPIESLEADVGDKVHKGQVLARLSQATLNLQKSQITASQASARAAIAQAQASLTEAKSTAEQAQRTADRTARLFAAGTASTAANDNARAALVSAKARVAVAAQSLAAATAQLDVLKAQIANVDLQLSRTQVVAPVSGIVTARNATLGAIASAAGPPMFTLVRDGALELRVDVDESDVTSLAVGQTATITLAAGGKDLTGKVRLVEPTIDTTTRLGHARIAFDDSAAVRVGMFAQASILVAQRDALALPITAIATDKGQQWVMVVKDGVVHKTPVTTGINDGAWVEIASGVSPGDKVVAKAGAFVRDGDRIDPVPLAMN